MALNITQKIIKQHLVSGEMTAKSPINIKMDQTLTQDATGTMAYLQFEALGVPRVRTELSGLRVMLITTILRWILKSRRSYFPADHRRQIRHRFFNDPATASATRFTSNVSANPAKP